MPKKQASNGKSSWRLSIPYADLSKSALAAAAVQLKIEGVKTAEDLDDPGEGNRTPVNNLIRSIMDSSVAKVASGGTSSIDLGDGAEEFFIRARTTPIKNEAKSQHQALLDYLGLEEEIILSEQDMVSAAIQAAKELTGNPDYDLTQLIRDGVRRVGQEMISNLLHKTNRKEGTGTGFTIPGARWDQYEEAYNKLKLEVGTPAWGRRKPFITLSYIAGKAEPQSNVIQIRRWAEATGQQIVPRPPKEEFEKDPTVGCLIVDDKL